MPMIDNNNNSYTFDISLTNDCNFQCVYCIERGYFKPEYLSVENAKLITTKLKQLYNSEYFKTLNIQHSHLGFWGGEPTLNLDAMKIIVEEMKGYNVSYGIFTNGYLLTDELCQYISDVNKHQYFEVQISYDGFKLQNECRKCSKVKSTGILVKNAIQKVYDFKIPFHLKSTLSFQYFKYLYESYLDICDISDMLKLEQPLKHSITIDYSPQTLEKLSQDNIEEYTKDLEYNLLQIAKNEKQRYINNLHTVFSWFDMDDFKKRAKCGAGKNFFTIDTDGTIYTCHGCIYSNKIKEHTITNIINKPIESVINLLQKQDNYFSDITMDEPEYCKDCETQVCFRCNCIAYEYSNETEYKKKWKDFSNQKALCKIYKMVSDIYISLLASINQSIK